MAGHFLIVEDEARIADFLVCGLTEEGYQVEHFAHGDSGRLGLETGKWDLVLLDWWLPGEDGISLLRRFRQRDRSTPVLFFMARDAVSQRVEGLDAVIEVTFERRSWEVEASREGQRRELRVDPKDATVISDRVDD